MGRRSAPVAINPATFRLRAAWTDRPFTIVLAFILIVPGAIAVIFGDRVSKALSALHAGAVAPAMGVALMAGGAVTILGIAYGRALAETMGLVLLAAGLAVYGVGVILGLGLGGMVSGPISLAVSLAMVRRVVTLAAIAPQAARDDT